MLVGDGAGRVREAFQKLKNKGHEVYLWSSGGAGYAAVAAELLGVEDLVDACFGKHREPEVSTDFAVDDDASVVGSYGGYRVEPFGGDPHDEEVLRVAEVVYAREVEEFAQALKEVDRRIEQAPPEGAQERMDRIERELYALWGHPPSTRGRSSSLSYNFETSVKRGSSLRLGLCVWMADGSRILYGRTLRGR